jgi:YhcH/YjgK/YiaL family protein
MIIDSLENARKYSVLHPSFEAAFSYLQKPDLAQTEVGKFELEGSGLKVAVSVKPGSDRASAKFEAHDHHIDIQVCLSGSEELGWKPRSACTQPKEAYNPEKDVTFYLDQPDMYFRLQPGQFAIFFPEDVHAPMIGEGEIKKMVIKVKA